LALVDLLLHAQRAPGGLVPEAGLLGKPLLLLVAEVARRLQAGLRRLRREQLRRGLVLRHGLVEALGDEGVLRPLDRREVQRAVGLQLLLHLLALLALGLDAGALGALRLGQRDLVAGVVDQLLALVGGAHAPGRLGRRDRLGEVLLRHLGLRLLEEVVVQRLLPRLLGLAAVGLGLLARQPLRLHALGRRLLLRL